ncbi:ubiquinone biosynthesis hydrox [Ceraceosorus guamensis]|uniref:Ubiquinone biosynthesis hydrox n=1 Tax=Ceraceosorus guamensis TaxID=1522189 RepID=A0A316W2T5_9BASI|nr:ubiquinone biosynthesis hydrox [Ceraceosorus guamensis]PWN42891.1 ubiquinone biosynthesis hydrox [Ceraceosorus guamensis]
MSAPVVRCLTRSAGAILGRQALTSDVCACTSLASHRWRSKAFSTSYSRASDDIQSVDIAIVGAGVVGLALASSLTRKGVLHSKTRLALIDPKPLEAIQQWTPGNGSAYADGVAWSNRVISLNEENRSWLEALGALPDHLDPRRMNPIRNMRVTDGLTGSLMRVDAPPSEHGTEGRLASMVEIDALCKALSQTLDRASLQYHASTVRSVQASATSEVEEPQDAWPTINLSSGASVRARLLVGADGGNSPVRKYSRIESSASKDYGKKGVVGTLRIDPAHAVGSEGVARQRFLPTGPIAWLPVSETAISMVWTLPTELANAIIAMHRSSNDNTLLAQLVTAAHRLPWPVLRSILQAIHTHQNVPTPGDANRDWSWLSPLILSELNQPGVPDPIAGHEVPPAVQEVDASSVAAFPLRMNHAQGYSAYGQGVDSAKYNFNINDSWSEILSKGISQAQSLAGLRKPSSLADSSVSERPSQPGAHFSALSRDRAISKPRGRVVLVGDAAHTTHPLAGQGLNLGIADARSLSNHLVQAARDGSDLGVAAYALAAYESERWGANETMLKTCDSLDWVYGFDNTVGPTATLQDQETLDDTFEGPDDPRAKVLAEAFVWARSTGLEVVNELGPVKEGLARLAGSAYSRPKSTTGSG